MVLRNAILEEIDEIAFVDPNLAASAIEWQAAAFEPPPHR
jgi:hypothetical protein